MTPIDLLVEVIKEEAPEDIWQGSRLLGYRLLGNTNRGEVGEKFIIRYLEGFGISAESGENRTSRTDLHIGEIKLELKTASMGANRTFQYNHVRLDRDYHYLLCLGLCPDQIVYSLWRKGEVAEGHAGKLVRMAEGQSVTFKLTKKLSDMDNLETLVPRLQGIPGVSV